MKYKNIIAIIALITVSFMLAGCPNEAKKISASKETRVVEQQQAQYQIGQPVPTYDWSLERDLVIKLYNVRNQRAATHSVWRSDRGLIEGDCPSYGYGIPYDTSLTNPLVATNVNMQGRAHRSSGGALTSVEQPEPNGIFASKNTAATWVMCLGTAGTIEPVYVETKVTVYPGPVKVDYSQNRVTRSGAATVLINTEE